jgi:predicted amidohydrolase
MSPGSLRVAAVQFEPLVGDRQANVLRFEEVVSAHGEALDLMVFPELFTTGYDLTVIKDHADALAEPIPGPTTELAIDLAARHDVTLSLTILESDEGRLHDTMVLVTGGGLEARYRKSHLYPNEISLFIPGGNLDVFAVDGVKYGPMICFEHAFPEVATTLALRGAQVLLIPSAVPRGYEYLLTLRTRARAQDNQVFAIAANLVGEEPDGFCGMSLVVAPDGRILGQGPARGEVVVVAEIDVEEIAAERSREPALHMRLPELYEAR